MKSIEKDNSPENRSETASNYLNRKRLIPSLGESHLVRVSEQAELLLCIVQYYVGREMEDNAEFLEAIPDVNSARPGATTTTMSADDDLLRLINRVFCTTDGGLSFEKDEMGEIAINYSSDELSVFLTTGVGGDLLNDESKASTTNVQQSSKALSEIL